MEGESVISASKRNIRGQVLAHDFESRATFTKIKDLVVESNSHLRKPQDDVPDSDNEAVSSIINDLAEMLTSIQQASDDDAESDQQALKTSVMALSLVKDHIANPRLIALLPQQFHSVFRKLSAELDRAGRHVQTIEALVSEHYMGVDGTRADTSMTGSRHLVLSSETDTSTKYHYNSAVKGSDYHHRATYNHMRHHSLDSSFNHQQGYHRARVSRQEGGTRRRLSQDDGNVCVDVDFSNLYAEQCYRLASCALNYNIYDLFVFTCKTPYLK